jgi:hypothetical protein
MYSRRMVGRYARIPFAAVTPTILHSTPVLKKVSRCRPKQSVPKKPVPRKPVPKKPVPNKPVPKKSVPKTSTVKGSISTISEKPTMVYVLQLVGGLIYVGQSSNVERRIQQHLDGRGAMFTRRHKPTGLRLARLGTINGAGDSGERQEVLLQMRMHGMESVRGWKYCNNRLSPSDIIDIRSNWVEMFNLCRRCMGVGHMASSCKR